MKIIIAEDKFELMYEKFIDKLIKTLYGELEVSVDDGYYHFNSDAGETPFGRNSWGRLWVNDHEFLSKYMKMMVIFFKKEEHEALDILKKYFIDKYNIKIKDVDHEFWFDDDFNIL